MPFSKKWGNLQRKNNISSGENGSIVINGITYYPTKTNAGLILDSAYVVAAKDIVCSLEKKFEFK